MLVKIYWFNKNIIAAYLEHNGKKHLCADIGWNRDKNLLIRISNYTLAENNESFADVIKCSMRHEYGAKLEELELELIEERIRLHPFIELIFNYKYYENYNH